MIFSKEDALYHASVICSISEYQRLTVFDPAEEGDAQL